MDITEYNAILPLVGAAIYTIILVVLIIRRGRSPQLIGWVLALVGLAIVWEFSLFFEREQALQNLPISLLLLSTATLGLLTIRFIDSTLTTGWKVLGSSVLLLVILVNFLKPNTFFVYSDVTISISQGLSLLTWIVLNGVIIRRTAVSYKNTQFPWHANRLLFWSLILYLIFIAEALLLIENAIVATVAQALRIAGLISAAYAVSSYRIFDVRTRSRTVFAFLFKNLIIAFPLGVVIVGIQRLGPALDAVTSSFIIGGILLFFFLFYQSYNNIAERITYKLLLGEDLNTNKVVRDYSQAISRVLDVQQLSLLVIGTLSDLLETNKGALMLVTKQDNGGFEIEPIPAMGSVSRQPFNFPWDSVFMATLNQSHQPLLQYDIDFNPDFNALEPESREWLREQSMEAYVPIVSSSRIVGLIAIGPKNTAVPYQPSELELVQILADQTVIALQNSRLYSELGEQNDRVRDLNNNLIEQNERLEIMDRVKSDFITIASHELRTPLTQVKGYTDILAAMNEENALTREQTREIVGHVNRATLQLESLITAMLDASQLDVDGMQLTFVKTQLDTVLRLSIEPVTQAVRERRIAISMHGVEELPSIYADFKRLVQAFTNIIGNAVKYTPDRGEISIEARVIPAHQTDDDHIEIVISDSGIGIEPKFHDLIFEKFFRIGDPQLHSTGSTKFKGAGPGLGLPIARGVIEAHGGQIWVESIGEDEDNLPGSRFFITLPVMPKDARGIVNETNGYVV